MANIGRAYGRIIPPENDDDGGGFIALAIERERERDIGRQMSIVVVVCLRVDLAREA